MSESGPSQKKPAVPSWQAELKNTTPTEGDLQPQSLSRETLIEQAKKFLEGEEVRNTSTDKKISFLESKGLNSEEIQSLIGVTRHPDASAPAPSTVSLECKHVPSTNISIAFFYPSTTTTYILSSSFSSSSTKHPSSNHLPRVPHHAPTALSPRYRFTPPHHSLPLRRHLRLPLRHKQLPHRPHARFLDRVPPPPRLDRRL